MNEIVGKIDNKRVKFSDEKIEELFKFLKSKLYGKGVYDFSPMTGRTRWLVKGKWISKDEYMNDLKQRGKITSTDVNSDLIFLAGDSYDKYSNEERTKMCQSKATKILNTINSILSASSDPLFSQLKIEIKNTTIDYCYLKKDQYDDGNDTYCCQLWLKISYR